MKSLRIQGIYVGSRAMFDRMLHAISTNKIRPLIDRVFDFGDAPAALRYLQSAQHLGKVVINLSS
jgi:D-arabinose 1-dehydrogenase-like Zn-dependent alcohol dehydrogenase